MKRIGTSFRSSLLLFAVLLTALIALQCIEPPLEPIAPSWTTQLSIPLADITAFLSEAVGDSSTTIQQDATGGLFFEDTQTGQPVKLDTIKVAPQASANQVAVGKVEVSALPSASQSVTAAGLGLPATQIPLFPGATTTLPVVAVGDTTNFAWAAVDTGSLTLSVTNTLPMSVTFNGSVTLKNNIPGPGVVDTSIIASFPFTTIASNATQTHSASLANKIVWGRLRTAPVSVTIAALGGPLTINPAAGLNFTFGSSPLRVDSARALVPPQTVVSIDDSVIVVDDSVSVTDARFRRGTFQTRLVNNLDVQVGVRLKFANFLSTVSGDTMNILRTIGPRSEAIFPFSLDTIRLINPFPDPIGTRVRFSVGIETITSANQKATITTGDFVRAEFTPQNSFVLQSVTGKIKPIPLAIESGAPGVNLGDANDAFAADSIKFQDVRIEVLLGMTGGYPVGYDLMLEARNRKTNSVASISLPPPQGQSQNIFNPSGGQITSILLGNAQGLSAFLSNFYPNFPDTFIVRGSIVVNPGFASATIYDTSKFYQSVKIYFPLMIGLSNARIEDKMSLEDSEFPTEFAKDVQQASLRFNVANRIPAQVGFRLWFVGKDSSTAPRRTLLMIPGDGSTRVVAAAPVDGAGNATTTSTSLFSLGLTAQEVDLFNKADTMYYRIELETSGAGAQAVRFRTSDYIRLMMSGNLVYIVNNPN